MSVTEIESEGLLYHRQMLERLHEFDEQVTRNAMVMLCLAAKEHHPEARFVALEDCDQGDWQTVMLITSALPDGMHDVDLDPSDEFDDDGWASCLTDRTGDTWRLFCAAWRAPHRFAYLDVERVLAEVSLPWRPAGAVWPEGDTRPCVAVGSHLDGMRHPREDCPAVSGG